MTTLILTFWIYIGYVGAGPASFKMTQKYVCWTLILSSKGTLILAQHC